MSSYQWDQSHRSRSQHLASNITPGRFLINFSIIIFIAPNQTTEAVGCMEPTWCPHVPRIYLFQVLVSLFLLTPGFAASSVTLFSIYSRILGPFPQVFATVQSDTPTTYGKGSSLCTLTSVSLLFPRVS